MIKKIFPILAIILVLTCVSSVSAEDNQTHSITSENTIQHESNHVDKTITKQTNTTVKSSTQTKSKVYVSTKGKDSNSGTKNSPKATIKDAIKSVKTGGTIYLASGTYDESEIYIGKSLNIVGAATSTTVINSKNKHTFTIKANVKLKTFTIKNARDKNGGAIYNKGSLSLESVKIQSSKATQMGGAIYNKGTLNAYKSTFNGNNAMYGGAIYNTNKLTLSKCSFTNNNAGRYGSSTYTTGYMNVYSCNYDNNRNTSIFIKKNNRNQQIRSSSFKSNKGINGGAIYNQKSNLTISKTYFGKNSAKTGGAIYNSGNINIKKSTFTANNAKNGGALYNTNKLIITDNSVKNNVAQQSGGVIYNTGKTIIKTSKFNKNSASNGGVLYSKTSSSIRLNIMQSEFTNNVAKAGGAMYIKDKSEVDVRSCAFNNNNNNAIFLKTSAKDNIVYKSSLTKNDALRGGAIRNNGGKLLLKSNYISANKATWGGAVYNNNGQTTLKFNTILNNGQNDVYNKKGSVEADYNWWGSNSRPATKRTQNVALHNWIYMTLKTANTVKVNNAVKTTVSLKNAYNGKRVTSINPELYESKIIVKINGAGISKTLNLKSRGASTFTTKFTKAGSATITATMNKQQLRNSVSVTSKTSTGKVTGLFVQRVYSVSSSVVKSWVNAGITDVFVQTQASSGDTKLLRQTINLCKGTNIRVHAWIVCFVNSNGNFDMSTARQNLVKNFVKSTIRISGVSGINLDYVRYSGTNPGIVNPSRVTNFVKSLNSIIKGYDKNIIFSACVFAEKSGTVKYYGQDYAKLSPYLDWIMPMTYKYSYSSGRSWLKDSTNYVVKKAKSSKVISILQTYNNNNINRLSSGELEGDARAVISGGSYGYVLFRYGLISSYPRAANKL
ncbi:MAG: hypothetical protein IJI98_09245 [Methanosphaera sp.]|nr:hypothetical protein [Methanosphaera sp.]